MVFFFSPTGKPSGYAFAGVQKGNKKKKDEAEKQQKNETVDDTLVLAVL